MALKYVQTNTFYQAGSGSIIGATTIVLTSFTDIYGNILTMTDFGSKGYITLEPDTNNEESATFTGVTANTNGTYSLTGVSTALAKSLYTETSALVRQHSGGTKVVVSDTTAFWNTFGNKQNDEALVGRWTTPVAPLNGNDLVNKTYADGLAIAGAPDSSTTVKGIGKVSVAPVSPTSPIFVGDNDGRVPTQGENDALVGDNTDIAVGSGNKFVTQTGFQKGSEIYGTTATGNDTYVVTLSPAPISYDNGRHYFVKLDVGNTGAATINFNGLGARSIVTGISTPLVTGDMLANGIYELIYNSTGTVFQLVNPASAVLIDPTTSIYNSTIHTSPINNATYSYIVPLTVTSSSTITGWTASAGSFSASVPIVSLQVNVSNMSIHSTLPETSVAGYVPNDGKTVSIKIRASFTSSTGIAGFGMALQATPATFFAAETDVVAGFRFVNNAGALFAQNANGTTKTSTNVTGSLTLTNLNTYEIVFTPGTSALFYINGVLVATQTTNLPTTQTLDIGYGCSVNTNSMATFPPVVTMQT